MFTLRRYTPADREAVEYLHVQAIQQAGAIWGVNLDDDVYAIEETYLNNQGEFLMANMTASSWLWEPSAAPVRNAPRSNACASIPTISASVSARSSSANSKPAPVPGYKTLHLDTSICKDPPKGSTRKMAFAKWQG